ncbi:MAG: response regulator transcription factor [Prevotella sp.]|nr:response regulator transcription factor [Prevotella sp.]
MEIILADNQDITRAGLMHICSDLPDISYQRVSDKAGLVERLRQTDDAVVVLDYSLFDIGDVDDLEILHARFPYVRWVLFSFELSCDFVRRVVALSSHFSILLKDSPMQEIRECVLYACRSRRFICQRMAETLLAPAPAISHEDARLTPTELQILKDIALGLTTREIADKRISSFHTVNTHRKNIFRKLGVNNVHEATKYALRAGLVDSAEYYI